MSKSFKTELKAAMKQAMRDGEKSRLGTIRMIMAEIKRVEVDERIDVDDTRALQILDKMVKQRRDSLKQFDDAGRTDLADIERAELDVLQDFMPEQLSEAEILAIVKTAITDTGAESMKDMGKVMAAVKPKVQGRADMAVIGTLVKQSL